MNKSNSYQTDLLLLKLTERGLHSKETDIKSQNIWTFVSNSIIWMSKRLGRDDLGRSKKFGKNYEQYRIVYGLDMFAQTTDSGISSLLFFPQIFIKSRANRLAKLTIKNREKKKQTYFVHAISKSTEGVYIQNPKEVHFRLID